MPLYEYRCDDGHTFEVVQKISEDALSQCATCTAPARRVLHAPAVHFKGKGFYNTDYGTRNRQKEKESGDGASSSSESSGSSEGKGESKSGSSEGKSESKPDKKDAAPAKS